MQAQGIKAFATVKKIRDTFSESVESEKRVLKESDFQFHLREIARLIRADVGMRIAFTSYEGWDTHIDQEQAMRPLMQTLGGGLLSLRNELKKSGHWEDTAVLVMTEFGRTVRENGGLGSDHGHGSAALVLGGTLKNSIGGKVVHNWKELSAANLSEGRDLSVQFDYRDVIGELLMSQLDLKSENLTSVFPHHMFKKIGVFS
jgi:uncharacterized protein (DUF1501 family)